MWVSNTGFDVQCICHERGQNTVTWVARPGLLYHAPDTDGASGQLSPGHVPSACSESAILHNRSSDIHN